MKNNVFLFVAVLFLNGCAGNHLMTSDGKCLTCFNNPITGKGINHEGSYQSQTQSKEKQNTVSSQEKSSEINKEKCVRTKYDSPLHCDPRLKMERTNGDFEIEVPVDVDLAYARIKRYFNYKTKEEVKTESGMAYEFIIKSNSYKYIASPGTTYTMKRDFSDYSYNGELLFTVIEVYMERISENKTLLSYKYTYADPQLSKPDYEKDLQSKINKALRI